MAYVNLKSLLRKKGKYRDLTKKYISYIPDKKTITLKQSETGWIYDQVVETELDLTWNPFMDEKGNMYLIGDVTRTSLFFGGETGYENGVDALEKYGTLYCNSDLKTTGSYLDYNLFCSLPRFLKSDNDKKTYWIAEAYEKSDF